jgi:hypothetical protein
LPQRLKLVSVEINLLLRQDGTIVMLLVLAHENDETAKRFVAYAKASGVACVMPLQVTGIDLCVTAERDRQVVVEICIGKERTPVHAVLNRGLPFPDDSCTDVQFRVAETLAAWWSALACFAGPVVNRPSRLGFIPNLEAWSLVRSVSNIKLAPIYIATGHCIPLSEPCVNVHLLRDGRYLGKISKSSSVRLNKHDMHVFTGFDPTQTVQLLLAGNRIFNLTRGPSCISPILEDQLDYLIKYLRTNDATFSLLVLQQDADRLRLVHATSFPGVQQYQYMEADVHRALLEYLNS